MPRKAPLRPLKSTSRNARRRQPGPLTATQVRVVVADHHAIDRGGMVGLLEDERDFEVVGEAATVEEVIQQCRTLTPSVLVLSLNLPGESEQPALTSILASLPALRVLAMSDRGTHNCLVLNPPSRRHLPDGVEPMCEFHTDCLQLAASQGAMGTLRRDADPEDLFRAIRAIASGNAWYDSNTVAGLMSISGPAKKRAFSAREIEVAALIAEGRSNKEISTALKIGEPTVKKHVGHILDKLGLADRLQAGLYLARNPLVLKG